MRIYDYLEAIIADLRTTVFLKDVDMHGKVFGAEELQELVIVAPACRIALIGSRGTSRSVGRAGAAALAPMGRIDTGEFRGPMEMVAFLIEQDWMGEEARNRVIKLADDFMYYIEHRNWGLNSNLVGPALISSFDILYSADIDKLGAAIAAVNFEQEVTFGRSLHDEDMALLTGDITGHYPSPKTLYPEKEWADKGKLVPETTPQVDPTISTTYTHETATDTTDIDFEKFEND